MARKHFLTLFLTLLSSVLCAKDVDPIEDNPVVNFKGAPSAMVNGCVNVITGDYTDFATDIYIPGPEPLTFERSYVSSDSKIGSLCHGWNKNHHGTLELSVERVQYNEYFSKTIIGNTSNYDRGLGVRMNYVEQNIPGSQNLNYRVNNNLYLSGLTNLSGNEISSRTNHKNDRFFCELPKRQTTLIDGYGSSHIFHEHHKVFQDVYFLHDVIKKNRLRYHYGYNKNVIMENMQLLDSNSNVLCSIDRIYPKDKDFEKDPHYDVVASNGRKVRYGFKKFKKTDKDDEWYLKDVQKDSGPNESYIYEKYRGIDKTRCVRVVKKILPDLRCLEIGYWHRGNKKCLNATDLIAKGSEKDQRRRVAYLKQPVGHDATPIQIYTFNYTYDPVKKRGFTIVRDVQGTPKRYEYSQNRLDSINHYLDATKLHCKERYYWGPGGTFYEANLMSSTLCDSSSRIHRSNTNYYDDRGNIIVQRLFGNITGDSPGYLEMMSDGTPRTDNCEYDQTYYTYSDGEMSLKLTESHNDTAIHYGYHPGTDLLSHKFVYVCGSLVERQFYDYDHTGMKTLEISDDGSTTDINNLTGVTQRKITKIKPSKKPVGLPGEVSHYYVDLETGQEKLLRRIVNTYSAYGYLTKEMTYDSNNDFVSNREWKYDSMGNVLKEVNALGEETTYRYDANKNRVFEQGPRQDFYKEYVYDYSNRLIVESEIYTDGKILRKRYKYSQISDKISETDIYGNATKYEYDGLKRLIGTTKPKLYDADGKVLAQNYKVGLNIFNAIVSKTDPHGNQTKYTTNILGKPLSISHPDGTQETLRYNLDGTLRQHTDTNGITTYTEYDYQKRPTRKTVYSASGNYLFETNTTYSPYGILTDTDAAGNVTTFEYDGAGRLIRKCKGALESQFEYDTLGRVYKEINLLGDNDCITTTKLYDLLDRVTEERVENGCGELQSVTLTSYDCSGNKSSVITYGQAGTSILHQEYNAHGEVILSTDAEGQTTVTNYRYDYVNEHKQRVGYREIIDPKGNVTIIIKNAHGKDCTFIKKDAFDNVLQRYTLYFDGNENLIARVETVIEPDGTTRELRTLWEYNSANLMTRRIEAYGTPDQKELSIAYNALGQKSCVTKPDGTQILYEYDDFGRISRYYSSAGDVDYAYEYDLLNRPTIVHDLVTNTCNIKAYNENGHLVHEVLGNGITIDFDYDAIGRQTALHLPDASSFAYEFSGLHLKKITRKDKWGAEVYNHQYLAYDLSGRVQEALLIGAAGTARYEYDLLNRIRSIETEHWREVIAGFDEVGNITECSFTDAAGCSTDNFSYDNLNQLIKETGSVTHTYKNDSVYNRTAKDGQSYRLNNLNQVLSDGNASYQYDKNGNMISRTSATEKCLYAYDSLGRLVSVIIGDVKAVYSYDETNRRLSKQIYTQNDGYWQLEHAESYIYQGKHEIGSVDETGKILSLRVLGNGLGAEIGAAVALEIDNKIYAPVHNHSGNVVALIDAMKGGVVECNRHSAFGEEQIYTNDGKLKNEAINPWRYSSKRHDAETGYVYYGQRYYDPKLGRWITPDPIGYGDGPNLYAYVRNNPLTNIDLWGEAALATNKRFGVGRARQSYYGDIYKQNTQVIGWDLHFEKRVGGAESQRYVTSAVPNPEPMEPGKQITFANGIMNLFSDAVESAKHISKLADGCLVYGIHNATHGIINDLIECIFGLNFFRGTTPSKLLHQEWDAFFAKNGPDAVLLQFCHSQGAIHVRNALIDYPEELRKRIIVVAIAPAAYISPDICNEVHHYVSSRDFVPYFDIRGRAECKNTIHYLQAHDDAGIWDHSFNSPTYADAIAYHSALYKKQ